MLQPQPGGAGSRQNTFASLTLDRAAEYREDAVWLAAREAALDSRFLWLDDAGRMPVDRAADAPRWLDAGERMRWCPDTPAHLLGVRADRAYFMLHPANTGLPAALDGDGIAWTGLRQAGASLDAFDAGLFAYASALAHWQATTRFCCTCGAPLKLAAAGHRACCTGAACGQLHFPRTDPAVIVIVEHDGACLLGRQAGWPEGRYSTLAGFVEPGETLEAAVRREVSEEAGVVVDACHYHSSQPWPFPASLMLGFTATARHREITLRDGELEDARWFTPEQIVAGIGNGSLLPSSRVSVAWHLLADWLRERAGIDLAQITR
ncbi:MAG TPA: NAD(+) diphosphatase [Rhodanobacteraceae bacterium]|nr:NAD(+) diphosphatase [Rhodanobacteraceae bacterium]